MLSLDALSLILESAYACKLADLPHGKLLEYRLHREDNWQQIEIEAYVWALLEKKYRRFVERWENKG